MAKTLQNLLKQIEHLQKQADALRSREKADVVARIREAIAHYGITESELFGTSPAKSARKPATAAKAAEEGWQEGERMLAALSSNSELVVATRSNHMIHLDEPEVVVEAIRRVLDTAASFTHQGRA